MSSGDHIARELTLGETRRASRASARKASRKATPNTNAASGGGGRRVAASGKKPVTKQEVLAFNKLSDAVRKGSTAKIARFKAAGYGVFEDYSVHTSGKGFGKFFDKTSPKYKGK